MQKWFLFFRPIPIAHSITKDDSLIAPFAVYAVLSIGFGLWRIPHLNSDVVQKMGSLVYYSFLVANVIAPPFSPLVDALFYYLGIKWVMGLEGSLRRMILLLYYAGLGKVVCEFFFGIVNQLINGATPSSAHNIKEILTPSFLFPLLIISGYVLYLVFVNLQLIRVNYSIKFGTAIGFVICLYIFYIALGFLTSFLVFLGYSAIHQA